MEGQGYSSYVLGIKIKNVALPGFHIKILKISKNMKRQKRQKQKKRLYGNQALLSVSKGFWVI